MSLLVMPQVNRLQGTFSLCLPENRRRIWFINSKSPCATASRPFGDACWFQGKCPIPEKIFCDQEILKADALYLSQFIHALFGPEKALAYLQSLIPAVAGDAKLLLAWTSYKLNACEPEGIVERLDDFLHTPPDISDAFTLQLYAYLGRASLIDGQSACARRYFASVEMLIAQVPASETPHNGFALAEAYFSLGKEAAFQERHEKAETLYTQAIIAYCWRDLPVVVKTQPGVPFGNAQMEETGRHYPWLVRLLETVWALADLYVKTLCYQEAYALVREAARLALSMPWVYALEHLYFLVKLSCLIGEKSKAEQVCQVLTRGEPLFEQPPIRSKLAETFLHAEQKIVRERLVKLAHAFRRAKVPQWAKEAQTLAEHPLLCPGASEVTPGADTITHAQKAKLALEVWQNHLGLPGFLSEEHPLPDQLPW